MRIVLASGLALVFCSACIAQRHKHPEPFPTELVIGRDSFIDIGPPFNYYDLTFLHSDGERTEVERVSFTPPADTCYPRAEIETAHVKLNESIASMLHGVNPCEIPEKALQKELKRRKKGLVFSGMIVSIQVQCVNTVRVIRADVLDRDIFGDQSKTPQYTSWSRALFEKLDQATGQNPWEKPVFTVAEGDDPAPSIAESAELTAIGDGKYDAIFGQTPDRPSVLYRLAKYASPRKPFIELTKIEPVRPLTYESPVYPPIAKVARVHGTVELHLSVGDDGEAKDIVIDSGPEMLRKAVIEAASKWKFSAENAGKSINASVGFGLNCAPDSKAE